MKKRALSLILAVTLCIGLLSGLGISASAAAGEYISTIATGYSSSFALKSDGTLWAWGTNLGGGLGDGTRIDRLTPVKVLDNVKSVDANTHGVYVIKNDNSLWSNYEGLTSELKMKYPELQQADVRTWYKIADDVKEVCGYAMFIKNDNSLWAWGSADARMGLGENCETHEGYSIFGFAAPVKIMDGVKTAHSGAEQAMVIKLDGSLWATGYNAHGTLGDGTLTDRYSYVKIMDGVKDVSIGNAGTRNHTMILKNDGSLWMCGSNFTGQFGNGNITDRDTFTSTPVKVIDGVKSISAGDWCSFIIKDDNSLWSCGSIAYGELGLGELVSSVTSFTKVMDDVADVRSSSHTLILKLDGSLWACGSNHDGQIGDGTIDSQPTPNGAKLRDNDKWTPVKVLEGVKLPITATTPVSDTPSSWAVEQVNAAITVKLVPEALQSKYTTPATRAEFCALAVALYETATGKTITERKTFDDTKDVNVEKAAAIGVVSGVGDNKFAPEQKLTREQAAAMLSRLADAMGKPLTAQAPTFADNANVSSWAFDAVGQMQATGIMGGVGNNTFSPATDYTREQSIMTMMRLFDLVK